LELSEVAAVAAALVRDAEREQAAPLEVGAGASARGGWRQTPEKRTWGGWQLHMK